MVRAFVAVVPPWDVLDAVQHTGDTLALPDVRFTNRAQWHITVQFLGDADVDAVGDALDDMVPCGQVVQLGGAGAFPEARRATVLWLGVTEGAAFLESLAAAVALRVAPLGHEPEQRAFHPHLTLARARRAVDLRHAVESIDARIGPPWTVAEVIVFESVLGRGGARYEPRRRVDLRA